MTDSRRVYTIGLRSADDDDDDTFSPADDDDDDDDDDDFKNLTSSLSLSLDSLCVRVPRESLKSVSSFRCHSRVRHVRVVFVALVAIPRRLRSCGENGTLSPEKSAE